MSSVSYSRRKSGIWGYFVDVGDGRASCGFCSKTISYKGGNTYNLHRHVRMKHPTAPLNVRSIHPLSFVSIPTEDDSEDSVQIISAVDALASSPIIKNEEQLVLRASKTTGQQPQKLVKLVGVKPEQQFPQNDKTAVTAVSQPQNLATPSKNFTKILSTKRNQEIDFALLETMVKDFLPFSIVESIHFQKFLSKLNVAYKMPTLETISNTLLETQYTRKKEIVKTKIQSAEAVVLTMEEWTSIRNENYFSVTAHYVQELELQCSLLECVKYDERHTSEDLAEELHRITMEWGIEEKVVCVVSDNTANIVSAIQLTAWNHIPCFASNLNLIVENGLQHIESILGKVRKVVQFFMNSSNASMELKQMQEELKEPIVTLKQDADSRWISTLDMLQRIVDVKNSLMSVLTINYPDLLNLTTDDIATVTQTCKVLKVFKDCVEEMCSERLITASKVILLSQSLKRWCCRFANNAEIRDDVQQMSEKLVEELSQLLLSTEESDIFSEATLLDPRFKLHGFSDKHFGEKAKQNLIRHCEKYLPDAPEDATETLAPLTESTSCLWAEFDEVVSGLHPKVSVTVEMDTYLQEPLLHRQANPLQWWSERQSAYPTLYELVKKRLCIVATSVPCERMFSKSGQLMTERRNHLTGKRVQQIIFLNGNT